MDIGCGATGIMIIIYQVLFISLTIMIAQWITSFLVVLIGGCVFEDWKDFIIKNSIISLSLIACIMVVCVICGIVI